MPQMRVMISASVFKIKKLALLDVNSKQAAVFVAALMQWLMREQRSTNLELETW